MFQDKDGNVRLVEVDKRFTSNKEPAMPYKSKKLMSQTVSIQRLVFAQTELTNQHYNTRTPLVLSETSFLNLKFNLN